jgi:EmrB/QacA subfamily drug resistance transporter
MVALDTLVVATALPAIRTDLQASLAELEWTVNAYNLSFAVFLMTAAGLGDRFGRRRLFAIGMGVFVVASGVCGLAGNVHLLIAARAAQGIGAAFVMTTGLALVTAAYPPARRGAALGAYFGITGLATVAGPVVGGAVTEGLNWHWVFWLNVPIGLVVIPAALVTLRESHGEPISIDGPGLALITAAALGVTWGLVRTADAGWWSVEVVAAIGGGLLAVVAFVWWERRAPAPMIPLHLFADRAFSVGNATVFLLMASLFGSVFFLSQFLQVVLDLGPLAAGVRLIPWTAVLLVIGPIAGRLADRFGQRPLAVGGLLLSALGMGWIAWIAEPGLGYGALVVPLVIGGIGNSLALPAIPAAAVGTMPPELIGTASGANSTMRELGGVFGIAVLVAVFGATGSYTSREAFTSGFTSAMAGVAVFAALGAVVASRLARTSTGEAGRRLPGSSRS